MNQIERFFSVLEGQTPDRAPFFPDIFTWYSYTRQSPGEEQAFRPGSYIADDLDFHRRPSRLHPPQSDWTLVDWYRQYGWGLPVHFYEGVWTKTSYTGGVEETIERRAGQRIHHYRTPWGNLRKGYTLAQDGSWAPTEYPVKQAADLAVARKIIEHSQVMPTYAPVEKFNRETEGFGVCDVVIQRSPFGKLIHEWMGFTRAIYALFDAPDEVHSFLDCQRERDLETIRLAAASPARIVMISDHADENLISPRHYRRYCIPFYQQACEILHAGGKYVSTHLDGNFKGYFPYLAETGFDLLDGCTPAPMFNYEVEELAAALPPQMHCYSGVPSTLFVQELPTAELAAFARRIVRSFDRRVIVNVGDILPPGGDIDQVIAVGEAVMNG